MMPRIDKTMAKHLKKKTTGPRLNARIPSELLDWAREYAYRKHTTLTQIIVDHFRDLRARDTDVPQI